MSSKHFRRSKDFYFESLDRLAERLSARDDEGRVSPYALARVMAAFLESDHSVAAWFERKLRDSTDLRSGDGWSRLFKAAGGAVVERYIAERPLEAIGRPVLTRDQIVAEVQEVLATAVELGQIAETRAQAASEVVYRSPDIPQMIDVVASELEEVLEHEVLLAHPVVGEFGIPKDERDLEIAKRALVHLRIGELRQIADDMGLPSTGGFDLISERIAKAVELDSSRIAQLVLSYEAPSPERSIGTRLLPLRSPPNLDAAYERLQRLIGNYVRIGVAKWLVVLEVTRTQSSVRMRGLERLYRVAAETDEDDYGLAARMAEGEVTLRLNRGVAWCEVSIKRGVDIRAIAAALRQVAGLDPYDFLPIKLHPPAGEMVGWDIRTVAMLEFLVNRLDERHRVLNMTVAAFDAPIDDTLAQSSTRPAITSVTLQGQQLMSSPQACQFITSGRGLVALDLRISFRPSTSESFVVPVHVNISTDHAFVATALTDAPTAAIGALHNEIISRLRSALESEIANVSALTSTANQIQARAAEQRIVEVADILVEVDARPESATT